jgi:hypothetical protein
VRTRRYASRRHEPMAPDPRGLATTRRRVGAPAYAGTILGALRSDPGE